MRGNWDRLHEACAGNRSRSRDRARKACDKLVVPLIMGTLAAALHEEDLLCHGSLMSMVLELPATQSPTGPLRLPIRSVLSSLTRRCVSYRQRPAIVLYDSRVTASRNGSRHNN
jgi:hypothetical protein